MKTQIVEMCLTDGRESAPFAVLVEADNRCAWSIAADPQQERDKDWVGHVLASKGRRASEWWALDAWRSWLADMALEPPERRAEALRRLAASTPGILVKRAKAANTRLPPRTVARRWRRSRLHDRAEVIAAEIVARLSPRDAAHWASALFAEGHEPLPGDWVFAYRRDRQASTRTERSSSGVVSYLFRAPASPSDVETDTVPVVVRIVNPDHLETVQNEWAYAREVMGAARPFGLAIVRGWETADVGDGTAVVGDRFAAPVLLAVAAIRAHATVTDYSARSFEPDG